MNYKDVALMDQAFGNLQDSILRNRMMEQNKQNREQDVAFRERELADREQGEAYQRDPKNPENRIRTAQASMYEDQVKKLGITKMKTSWTTADGRDVTLDGTAQEIKDAMASAPPSPQSKVKSSFITKDGVSHTIEGTPEQLKAQQESLAKAGGGIQDTSTQIQEVRDSEGNVSLILRNPRTGSVHTIKAPQAWETETLEYDDLGRPKTQIRRPVAPGKQGAGPGKPITKKLTTPQEKADRANQLAEQHPEWNDTQIKAQVQKESM